MTPPADRSEWTMPRLISERILDELAGVFADQPAAHGLLENAGYPRAYMSAVGTLAPVDYWRGICQQILNGRMVGGFPALLAEAARQFPGNAVFARWLNGSRSDPWDIECSPGPVSPDQEASISLYGADDPLVVLDVARQLAGNVRVSLAFANADVVTLLLQGGDSSQATQLLAALQQRLGLQTELQTASFRPYMYSRLYLEGPDQSRFELSNVPAATRVMDIAKAGITEYDETAWPRDRQGMQRQAVMDHVTPDGTHRLDPQRTLHDAGVRDGDTLHMAPESTAGAVNPLLREEALARVRGQVKRFADAHPEFRAQSNSPHAPTEYRFQIQAPGWAATPDHPEPYPVEQHTVLLQMPPDFPMKAPQAYWLAPSFHPNIHPKNGAVCLGMLADHYRPGMDMGELCQMLLDMAAWRNYEVREVYNMAAAKWADTPEGQAAIEQRGGSSLLRRVLGVMEQEQASPLRLRIKRLDGTDPAQG